MDKDVTKVWILMHVERVLGDVRIILFRDVIVHFQLCLVLLHPNPVNSKDFPVENMRLSDSNKKFAIKSIYFMINVTNPPTANKYENNLDPYFTYFPCFSCPAFYQLRRYSILGE